MTEPALQEIKKTLQESRTEAIVRCVKIALKSGARDLAKEFLRSAGIDQTKFVELASKNTTGGTNGA